ncbi:MAG: PQQ-binding-like beta-propeller repeat protein [Candidatus Bilamarchaeaceae archaeon]
MMATKTARTVPNLPLSILLFLSLLSLFSSLSFSSQIWSIKTDAPVTTQGVEFQRTVAFGSYDGYVYFINPEDGTVSGRMEIGKTILQPALIGEDLLVATDSGKIVTIRKGVVERWKAQLGPYVYGITVDPADMVAYATATDGLYSIAYNGTVRMVFRLNSSIKTAPTVDNGMVIFGSESSLFAVSKSGTLIWEAKNDRFWKSDPVISGNTVYIGALDNSLTAYNLMNGFAKWKYPTYGWVLSTPAVRGDIVVFGSNDGDVYALNAVNGEPRWSFHTDEAVQGRPLITEIGGKAYVAFGSNDGNLYMVSLLDGTEEFRFNAKGWVHSPILYGGNLLLFGSHDENIYAVSAMRGCSITEPPSKTVIGYRKLMISGTAFSEFGSPTVFLRVSGGEWVKLEADEKGAWSHLQDVKDLPFDTPILVECKIRDAFGEELSPYSRITLQRSKELEMQDFKINYDASIRAGQGTAFMVLDADYMPVEEFTVDVDGKTLTGKNGNMTITFNEENRYALKFKADGFRDSDVIVSVGQNGMMPLLGFAILVVIIIGVFLVTRKKKE